MANKIGSGFTGKGDEFPVQLCPADTHIDTEPMKVILLILEFLTEGFHYFLKEYDSAIKYFEKVVKTEEGRFHQTAQWYLALSYIGNNEIKKAEKTLNEIVAANGSFHENTLGRF